ncbi:hypothetical protein HD554DRAFT_2039838 [Boletus coccyginus]|nr:hypothetical protein HD554DRAFT_2039838 [Boletus coccyginus]
MTTMVATATASQDTSHRPPHHGRDAQCPPTAATTTTPPSNPTGATPNAHRTTGAMPESPPYYGLDAPMPTAMIATGSLESIPSVDPTHTMPPVLSSSIRPTPTITPLTSPGSPVIQSFKDHLLSRLMNYDDDERVFSSEERATLQFVNNLNNDLSNEYHDKHGPKLSDNRSEDSQTAAKGEMFEDDSSDDEEQPDSESDEDEMEDELPENEDEDDCSVLVSEF